MKQFYMPVHVATTLILIYLAVGVWGLQSTSSPSSLPFVPWDYNGSQLLFYQEHTGLHLTEGIHQKWIYNVDVTECARRCTYSGAERPDQILCRSFEFFPFEDNRPDPPWNELSDNGICVLNSGDMSSGRMRYEDDGMTDAELLYTSHFTHRSGSSHFEGVDRAWGNNPVFYPTDPQRIPLASSRQGAVVFSKPQVKRRHFQCKAPLNGGNVTVQIYALNRSDTNAYRVGFAPVVVATNQCPGPVDKETASSICWQAGAELCTQRDLRILYSKDTGCNIDGSNGVLPTSIWAYEDILFDRTALKYVKCCSDYRFAFTCESYTQENINFCSSFKTEDQCVMQGSGFARQATYGFGNFLYEIRRGCLRDVNACGKTTFSEWAPRDRCIWCGTSCRPGSDVGVCPQGNSPKVIPQQMERINQFAAQFNVQCSPQAACAMTNAYPDLSKYLVEPFLVDSPEDNTGPLPPVDCRQFKTDLTCLQNYDSCWWGQYYGLLVCRDLDKFHMTRAPAPRKKPIVKKKKKSGR